jgi:hypothetical protein
MRNMPECDECWPVRHTENRSNSLVLSTETCAALINGAGSSEGGPPSTWSQVRKRHRNRHSCDNRHSFRAHPCDRRHSFRERLMARWHPSTPLRGSERKGSRMRKFGFFATTAVILAGFAGWIASTSQARVTAPMLSARAIAKFW